MKRNFSLIFLWVLVGATTFGQYAQLVNPFIGTGGHGHTFPGPTTPFGMVQLGPDTRLEGWDGCSGYHYSDSIIYGFSHTHLSGTGIADYCDVLIMPSSGDPTFVNLGVSGNGYASTFEKTKESASPGLYQVLLNKYQIQAKLTTTPRTGIHEYTFPKGTHPWIIIDLKHRDKLIQGGFTINKSNEISGYRISNSWAKEQHIYFNLITSMPFYKVQYSADSMQLICFFERPTDGKILLQCAISPVDMEGAKKNLKAEHMHFNFKKAYEANVKTWESMLSRIRIQDEQQLTKKRIFYTALYHTLMHPNIYQDVDGRFRGMDKKIHQGDLKKPRYTVFSLWDTYRAAHPLYELIYPEYNQLFVETFLEQFKECGRLPVWELAGNETYCMIGNHSIPVIVNAYLNHPKKYSKHLITTAIQKTLNQNFSGLEFFNKQGFISSEESSESVSKTIENSLDYYAASLMNPVELNLKRAAYYYKNLFNPDNGFFQAKLNHKFITPFAPNEVNQHYTEANAWHYMFGAHHDIEGIKQLLSHQRMNGSEKNTASLENKLDELFRSSSEMSGRVQSDITGLIGQYAHGNEPSHHVGYLYNYCGRYDKTQDILQHIMDSFYLDAPDGLCGNEDCGQMSAWYVFSALGFYPVNPINGSYDKGIPQFGSVRIVVPGHKEIKIKVNNREENIRFKVIKINGKLYDYRFEIHSGDQLEFLTAKQIHYRNNDVIYMYENHSNILPYVQSGDRVFNDSTVVSLAHIINQVPIEYCLGHPNDIVIKYNQPLVFKNNTALFFRLQQVDHTKSNGAWLKAVFDKRPSGLSIQLNTPYASQYSAGGVNALHDGLSGSLDFRDGFWQGYWGKDLHVDIVLDSISPVHEINLRCLQDQNSWIALPKEVKFYYSLDGKEYKWLVDVHHDIPLKTEDPLDYTFKAYDIPRTKYLRIEAINYGQLPSWHIGAGGDTWIFADEIQVKLKQ